MYLLSPNQTDMYPVTIDALRVSSPSNCTFLVCYFKNKQHSQIWKKN